MDEGEADQRFADVLHLLFGLGVTALFEVEFAEIAVDEVLVTPLPVA